MSMLTMSSNDLCHSALAFRTVTRSGVNR
ncbi:hypothetical protein RB2654_14415 [Rhodobacterales bacterium HTCC2654]|uniref:Uncharacterized protein n=1 Tax=Maritimibacter alkaliphilus HTCC2654 TaxID=314271 RepID=A3VGT2_9RHOB|nr:hypothetical protein RB2654_14415 [Rhodobacterales bacterium HTCC2654] [Maritimibacter alkaliphilus HTCC2654]